MARISDKSRSIIFRWPAAGERAPALVFLPHPPSKSSRKSHQPHASRLCVRVNEREGKGRKRQSVALGRYPEDFCFKKNSVREAFFIWRLVKTRTKKAAAVEVFLLEFTEFYLKKRFLTYLNIFLSSYFQCYLNTTKGLVEVWRIIIIDLYWTHSHNITQT